MDIYDKADYDGQLKAVEQLKKIFSGATLTIEQHFDDKANIDLYVTATTENTISTYAIECKDRQYTHTYSNEWFIEYSKYKRLMESKDDGYKPIYLNTFKDDYIAIWNVNVSKPVWEEKELRKTTVEDTGVKKKLVGKLQLKDSVYQGKFKS